MAADIEAATKALDEGEVWLTAHPWIEARIRTVIREEEAKYPAIRKDAPILDKIIVGGGIVIGLIAGLTGHYNYAIAVPAFASSVGYLIGKWLA